MMELFGLWANEVTVKNLIFMQSGIQDFEIGTFDKDLILPENSHKVHDPIEILRFVGQQKEKSPCSTMNCTWFFAPGTHTQYSSTNYVLAGYLLLSFMPNNENLIWSDLDLNHFLQLDPQEYKNLLFPSKGVVNQVGLTTSAITLQFGEEEIWD